jgi:hypothetical protein
VSPSPEDVHPEHPEWIKDLIVKVVETIAVAEPLEASVHFNEESPPGRWEVLIGPDSDYDEEEHGSLLVDVGRAIALFDKTDSCVADGDNVEIVGTFREQPVYVGVWWRPDPERSEEEAQVPPNAGEAN